MTSAPSSIHAVAKADYLEPAGRIEISCEACVDAARHAPGKDFGGNRWLRERNSPADRGSSRRRGASWSQMQRKEIGLETA